MNNLNISNIQRRRPRRSMLGTHRGYSIGLQLNEEPTSPKAPSETEQNTSTISVSITNMTRRPPRKSMLGTRNIRRDSIFSLLPETSLNESSIDVDTTEVICSPPKKKLDTIFSQESNDDSFEEHETIMMANENEESVLATTLLDNTIVEMNSAAVVPRLENADNTFLDTTITKSETDTDSAALADMINTLNRIIENNTRCVNRYYKQIDEIKSEIEEKNLQTEDLVNLKCRLMKKFSLTDSPNEPSPPPLPLKTNKTPELTIKCCKLAKCSKKIVVAEEKENIESPNQMAAPSRQIIRELRSTIKFLKTPRSSRRARPSTILTPHSMSFSIKSQVEKLLE